MSATRLPSGFLTPFMWTWGFRDRCAKGTFFKNGVRKPEEITFGFEAVMRAMYMCSEVHLYGFLAPGEF